MAAETELASWSGGSSSCETCGTNFDSADFYAEEDGTWYGVVGVGCYGGESVETTDWAEVERWLSDWAQLPGWSRFADDVRAKFHP